MKRFTDIFVQRPVLASVISLLLFFLGLRAILDLAVRQFPKVDNTVITVTTTYPGANAKLIQGFITTPIESAIASANGLDYLTAKSTQGVSTIEAHIRLNYDPNKAFTDIMSKVAQVKNQLPTAAQDPIITKDTGSSVSLMYISFSSSSMTPIQITDFISRVVQPDIETIPGVAQAKIMGGNTFAMRIWLNPQKMAARGITTNDISNALLQNNFQSAAGSTKGVLVAYTINAQTDTHDAQDFGNIIIKHQGDAIIRLKDVATIKLGSQQYDSSVTFNGKKATFIGINGTPTANPLTVISHVRALLPKIQKSFPPSLHLKVVYDATKYIRSSIKEVIETIIEATLIVILVIFLFLGSIRSVIIPVLTIPLSLVGVCSFMLMMGYSLNLLTLLAMVLAIGMVVDDAIVVVENIHRHIEEGVAPFNAAIQGAREIAMPVISMTITLAAVYMPIGFMGGLTGALFKEFAFTLAGAVVISGTIALTLSPMLCSKLLTPSVSNGRFVKYLDDKFERLKNAYQRRLHNTLNYRPVMILFAFTVLCSIFYLYTHTQKQLAPTEDQSVLFIAGNGPEYANHDYMAAFGKEVSHILKGLPQTEDYFVVNGLGTTNSMFAGLVLKPWNQRKLSQQKITPILQKKLRTVSGLQVATFPLPSLPTGQDGLPIQFVLTTTGSFKILYQAAKKLEELALKSGRFLYIDSTLKYNQPQLDIAINRSKAAEIGVSMQDIGNTLATFYGGNFINWFSLDGRSYQVIPQLQRQFRLNPHQLKSMYVKASNGQLIPLSTLITLKSSVQPNALSQFQQLNSATIEGLPIPGASTGDILAWLQQTANRELPKTIRYDYAGQSRSFIEEGNTLMYTFMFALITIFLVLSAQFESFRDPLIILISVPMSICGALIFLNLGLASINIYTQVGLITLIGLISKHGILMVEFANQLQQQEGLSIREAIEKAAAIRLRPILMTTAAMILGVFPLLTASGAGAVSRFDIGLVIATGMFIGTIFTLFIVPTMYTFLARDHQAKQHNTLTDDTDVDNPTKAD